MATEKLIVSVLVSYKHGYFQKRDSCSHGDRGRCSNCAEFIDYPKFKNFSVYYPTDGDWKERSELVRQQIVERIGSDEFEVYEWDFLNSAGKTRWDKDPLADKFKKLLLHSKGKTPIEDRWLKANRPEKPLAIKSYTGVLCW